jgi:xanthine dehydrogenase accessory factor
LQQIDAAVLMTHHLGKDAQWLRVLAQAHPTLAYLAMIGPIKRRAWVIELMAEHNASDAHWCELKLNAPAGFDIGGDLPESVALSILAEAHQVLENH